MRIPGESAIDLAELERAVTGTEPSALLVPSRLLRKVISRDRGTGIAGRRTPRLTSYAIAGEALAAMVEDDSLPRPIGGAWPSTVILLERPDADVLAGSPPESVLLDVWRRLFRARVREVVRARIESKAIAIPRRIDAIGRVEFEEIRLVLRQDGLVAAEEPDAVAYAEFASLFLERTYFAPALRLHAFPAIDDLRTVEELLATDADGPLLLDKTRPPGAPDLLERVEPTLPEPELDDTHEQDTNAELSGGRVPAGRLAARAERQEARGNVVGAAVLWARSARLVGSPAGEPAMATAIGALRRLTRRLHNALFLRAGEADEWAEALTPLLKRAAMGYWTDETRFLYDLQTVCLDHERETYRLDLLGWASSFGKKPLKIPLLHHREVAMSNHLRGAAKRLAKVKLSKANRLRLEGLLMPAVHQAEEALRDRFRPLIRDVLKRQWIAPRNLPEQIAFEKLVEELLDQIVHNGYLTLGDLRDAASRNQLKLPDLSGPSELFRGGKLLETDRMLAESLDGVHRRGEIYLRWLQRFSAFASGTRKGRWFSLYVALPFGGSFVLLEGLLHLIGAGKNLSRWVSDQFTGVIRATTLPPHHEVQFEWWKVWAVLALGSVALGVINYAQFRVQFFQLFRVVGRILRIILVDTPTRVLTHPLLRSLLNSRFADAFWRLGVKPGVAALVFLVIASRFGSGTRIALATGAIGFAFASFLINTRYGRSLEEAVWDGFVRAWRTLIYNLIPGLFRLVIEIFERVVEHVERYFYAVDEWLRFREGKSQASLVAKAVLGLFWFGVAYLARIYVNLLIEPQINPIKHFPVVTVSHKIILPLSVELTKHLSIYLSPYLGTWLAGIFVGLNVLLLPGVFGFLVWELKENWRLYEANRRPTLGPILVGSHGETISRLLRPGLHSGTLPKLYAKLRRSELIAREGRLEKRAIKQREALHHVEESVRRFLGREFIALLHQSRAMKDPGVSLGSIELATNRIRIELIQENDDHATDPSLWLDLEERQGVLAAGISQPGWLDLLDDDARQTLDTAIAGLFKLSGVAIVHTPGDLMNSKDRLDFAQVAISWDDWTETWDAEAAAEKLRQGCACVLPPC